MLERQTADPLWVDVKEAERLVGVSHAQMHKWIADGTVESVKVGRLRRISFKSLEELGKPRPEEAA